jgi:hypothetical protein
VNVKKMRLINLDSKFWVKRDTSTNARPNKKEI